MLFNAVNRENIIVLPKSRLIVDAPMVHDPGKAGARSRRGLVDTLPQRLKVIGDDDDDDDFSDKL